jgi:small subunit ribosomal protein S8
MNDPIADMLARIQNALMRKKESVEVLNTKINAQILEVLKQEDMIEDFKEAGRYLEVTLKYEEDQPVITHLQKVSKSGQRIYLSYKDIVPVMNGRGISVISTSKGVMNGAQAKSLNLGGELICEIW